MVAYGIGPYAVRRVPFAFSLFGIGTVRFFLGPILSSQTLFELINL